MDNLEGILNVLFKRISVPSILEGKLSSREFRKEDFVRVAFMYMKRYSESELSNMWMYYTDTFEKERKNYGRWQGQKGFCVYDALFFYVCRMLTVQNNEVLCKYQELQHWRQLTLQLSEDLLVSAYWAAQKSADEMMKIGFSWKTVIGHNNVPLKRIMQRGISENHFHLYGSTPMFHLSWISLMNNLLNSGALDKLKKYDYKRRQVNLHYGEDYAEDSLVLQYYRAALIRVLLFSELTETKIQIGNHPQEGQQNGGSESLESWKLRNRENTRIIMKNDYLLTRLPEDLQGIISALRNMPDTSRGSIRELEDYALWEVKDHTEDVNDIFSGERWFLYTCLSRIYHNLWDEELENLFYAYLLIKEAIRAELIQSNDNVGFANFNEYQSRKGALMNNSLWKNEVVRQAVRENMLSENICSLELRITPRSSAEQNYRMIRELDQMIGEPKEKYFYTLHFIKGQDEMYHNNGLLQCRHYRKRREVEKEGNAIVGLRERFPDCASRILGIDAAASEIGCRAEVFAGTFRYLRGHMKIVENGGSRERIPQLHVTYHVGEDFLDLADGLRAIDEAVNFLNMDCGDRLGHALALGVDVEEWYRSKNNRILIPQQDYLDNIVWMYNRLIQFHTVGVDALKDDLEKKFSLYFQQIYGRFIDFDIIGQILNRAEGEYQKQGISAAFHNDRCQFDMSQYYNAWKLRGDDPGLYEKGFFDWKADGTSENLSRINWKFPKTFELRYIPEVFLLNYLYHFNEEIRIEGNKRIEVKIQPIYIEGIKIIQKEMQKRIGRRGIGIETNPSSNYLIGTFKDYTKHPIFRFYNKGLTYDPERLAECPQLSVSVNTDDQGVFSTSLENEYALLASALEQAVDEKGEYIYNKAMVYEWIDAVRRMGNEQSFSRDRWQRTNEENDDIC